MQTNGILIGSALMAQLRAESPYTLQWAATFPSKLPTSRGDLDPSITFYGHIRSVTCI